MTVGQNMAAVPAEKSDEAMDFELAFAEASGRSSAPADVPPAVPPAVPATEDVESEAPATESEEPDKPNEDELAKPAGTAPEPNPLADKLVQLEQELARIKEMKPAEPPKPVEPPKPEKPVEFEFSEADKAVQAELAADWPTVQKGLELAQRQMLHSVTQLLEEKLAAVLGTLNTTMAPALKTVAEVEGDRFISAVKAAHPDLDTFYPKFEQWVNAHPPKLKELYSGLLNTGTAEEVVSLMGTYKKATAVAAPSPAVPKPADPAKAKRLDQMRGAKSEPSGVVTLEDKDDFYGAFARAVAARNQ